MYKMTTSRLEMSTSKVESFQFQDVKIFYKKNIIKKINWIFEIGWACE